MNATVYVIEDYENEPPSGPKKQTQFKPNFFKGQNRLPENPATHISTNQKNILDSLKKNR